MTDKYMTKLLTPLIFALFTLGINAYATGPTPPADTAPPPPTPNYDQQQIIKKEFLHHGKSERMKKELCSRAEYKAACKDEKQKVLGFMDPALMGVVGKVYSLILGSGALKVSVKGAADKAGNISAKNAKAAQDAQKGVDQWNKVCGKIAAVSEIIVMFKQQTGNQSINSVPTPISNIQKEALMKQARIYQLRGETAVIQSIGWGATAACYTVSYLANLAKGGISISGGSWATLALKAGGAAFLMAVSIHVAVDSFERKETIEKIAAQLPQKGECNPVSQRHCFCLEPSSKKLPEFATFCLPKWARSRKGMVQDGKVVTACVNQQQQVDPQCQCKKTKTCLTDRIIDFVIPAGAGQNLTKNIAKDVSALGSGALSRGTLASKNLNRMASRARQLMNKAGSMLDVGPGRKKHRSAIKGLKTKFLMPANLARAFTSIPETKESKTATENFGMDGLSDSDSSPTQIAGSDDSSRTELVGGKGNQSASDDLSDTQDDMASSGAKGGQGGKVIDLELANKAHQKAQINSENTSLFEIISKRYFLSGKRRLGGQ